MAEQKYNPFDRDPPDGQSPNVSGSYEMQNPSTPTGNASSGQESTGSLFRSEDMSLCQLFIQSEAGFNSVYEMGDAGVVQFRDLNQGTVAFQRKFVNEVRRCDEMERRLEFLKTEVKKYDFEIWDLVNQAIPSPQEMNELETNLEKLEMELLQINENDRILKTRFLELTEMKHVLNKTNFFLDDPKVSSSPSSGHSSLDMSNLHSDGKPEDSLLIMDKGEDGSGLKVHFLAGVISKERLPAFEKMLFRVSRGNAFLRYMDIEEALDDPLDNKAQIFKSVFVIFFQGSNLKNKIQKICEGFRATIYPCPAIAADRRGVSTKVLTRLSDLEVTLTETNGYRNRVLGTVSKNIKCWFSKVIEIKSIFYIMNMFKADVTKNVLIAECWIPSNDIMQIRERLGRAHRHCGTMVDPVVNKVTTSEDPPTFFRTNKYTSAFQALVDAYGVASPKEMNPAVFTIVTFPFLFGVMFGDVGHAFIIILFGLWMIIKEKDLEARKINSEIWQIFFSGRYLIIMMGIFGMYAGFMYNDCFSKSFNIFGSSYQVYQQDDYIMTVSSDMIDPAAPYNETRPAGYYGTPYIFGMDPVWQFATNMIDYTNTFKLKLSIIFGVCHMAFGICLSFLNHKYFKDWVSVWAEFVPQMLFFASLFGYLAFMIIVKWWTYFASNDPQYLPRSEYCAPNLLILFIDMFLFSTEDPEGDGCLSYYMGPTVVSWYYQQYGQYALIGIAVASIPIMLLGKPLAKLRKHNQIHPTEFYQDTATLETEEEANQSLESGVPEQIKEFDFSEIMILQGIHTIEFCLGCVSHTASYLRLWALSLAHNQLSEVLWEMVMIEGFVVTEWYGAFLLYAIFAFWAACTIAILVVMEGLSAFLHTLRLHWVEFQSKFYKGEGYPFEPYSLKESLKLAELDFYGSS